MAPDQTIDNVPAGAVILAAGASQRMGGADKIWMPLAGRLVLSWAVSAFEAAPSIRDIVLVVAASRLDEAAALTAQEKWHKVRAIVPGGSRRRDSARLGLEAMDPSLAWVVMHDGARPLVTPALIEAGLAVARTSATGTGTAIAVEPVKETLKRLERGQNVIVETPARVRLAQAQTPQIFPRASLLAAHQTCDPAADVPDDATLAALAGMRLTTYPGSHENLKLTRPGDIPVAEALLAARRKG